MYIRLCNLEVQVSSRSPKVAAQSRFVSFTCCRRLRRFQIGRTCTVIRRCISLARRTAWKRRNCWRRTAQTRRSSTRRAKPRWISRVPVWSDSSKKSSERLRRSKKRAHRYSIFFFSLSVRKWRFKFC